MANSDPAIPCCIPGRYHNPVRFRRPVSHAYLTICFQVYGQVTLTFRYGREDEEVMGLKFCNEAVMCLAQLYPPHERAVPQSTTPLQVRSCRPAVPSTKQQATTGKVKAVPPTKQHADTGTIMSSVQWAAVTEGALHWSGERLADCDITWLATKQVEPAE